jgi:NAD(P)-dependent dehydrogenase (short-subunit alcohol dehydrogenase family)
VRHAAVDINSAAEKIDILINNAAIMACPYVKTEDGIKSQFATNYIGHFLLTNLSMEKLQAGGRW